MLPEAAPAAPVLPERLDLVRWFADQHGCSLRAVLNHWLEAGLTEEQARRLARVVVLAGVRRQGARAA